MELKNINRKQNRHLERPTHFYEGIKNAIEKKFKPDRLDGQYGELAKLTRKPNVTKPLWLPFDWVKYV